MEVNAAQKPHKYSQKTVPALVKVTHQGVQTIPFCFKHPPRYLINLTTALKFLSADNHCFEIPLSPNQQIQNCTRLPNPRTPRLVSPSLQFPL